MKKKTAFLSFAFLGFLLSACTFDFSLLGSNGPRILDSSAAPTVVYPTSISLPSSLSVPVGGSRTLYPSFSPASTTEKQVTYASSNSAVASVSSNGVVTGLAVGQATITLTQNIEGRTPLTATTVVTVTEAEATTKMRYTYKDVATNNFYDIDSTPTKGSTKLLVIPVWFTDSGSYILSSKKEGVRQDIQTAYFGTASEAGWHSVKSYYETESFGALSINGTVSEWYECGFSASTVGGGSNENVTASIAESAANWYFARHPSEKRTDYDADGNGYLDGVMLIYAAPDYNAMERPNWQTLWAFCSWVQDKSAKNIANPGVNAYFWASYDFMYDAENAYAKTGVKANSFGIAARGYGSGSNAHTNVDTHTYIHEMGHMFGLDDYYDYGPNKYSMAASFSMQDENVGGHDPFSVLSFGWADPYIPTDSCTITLAPFQSSHDLILLTPSWNSFDSPFDEYLLLEFYTPTGLNALDCQYRYVHLAQGPNAYGIRLWHVDARLTYVNSNVAGEPVKSINQLTSNPEYGSNYGVIQAFTNTVANADYSGLNDNYNLLKLIRNSRSAPLHNDEGLRANDLFRDGSSFRMSDYSSQFARRTLLNGGSSLGWSFSVSIDGQGESMRATVELVRE